MGPPAPEDAMRTEVRTGPLNSVTVFPDDYRDDGSFPLLIGLHGFGADKADLSGMARVLGPTGYLHVFPDGPRQAFDGADPTQRAWHERGGHESPEAVRDALAALNAFISETLTHYRTPPGRVVLWGFSQGGAMALRYGLPRPATFAGLGVLSGSLRRVEDLPPTLPPTRAQPVFISHGRADAVIPADWAQKAAAFLERHGYRPNLKLYPTMGHFISPALVSDFRAWLKTVLPPAGS
jgi:phospholipase/carboxylesterase